MSDITIPQIPGLDTFLAVSRRRYFDRRSVIIAAGAESRSLFYLVKGSVTVSLEDNSGQGIIVTYLNEGSFFGEMGLFADQSLRSAWIKAKTDCEVAEVSYSRFRELTEHDSRLLYVLVNQVAARLRNTTRKVYDLAFMDVAGRVARTLLDLCQEPDALTHPDGMQLRITRQEIARIVGCSREMAGKVLKDLEEQGLISAHGKTIVVYGTR